MTAESDLHLAKLRRYVDLIGRGVDRAFEPAQAVELWEPAPPRFDAPPADGPWRPLPADHTWGGQQQWTYFRAVLSVPGQWQGGTVELRLDHEARYLVEARDDYFAAGPEGQVFVEGQRLGAIDREHRRIACDLAPGRTYQASAVFFAARCPCRHVLRAMGLVWVDEAARKLWHDLRVALEAAQVLDPSDLTRARLLEAVQTAVAAVDVTGITQRPASLQGGSGGGAGEAFYASIPAAQQAFDEAIAAIPPAGQRPQVFSVGHAHIDLAWLWPFEQTRHKIVRTFATQAGLLKRYPRWVFQQSSPQAYRWLEEDAPDLFEEVRQMIAQGRWEADGAMWVEADTNLTSGESLVRQLLYGKRYFRDKLGVDSRVLWLPDVFGYSAALPQLLKLANVEAFITSKISWSVFNRFPHDTFRWRGLDGTEIPTHFITTPCTDGFWYTYNAMVTPEELLGTWKTYRPKLPGLAPLMTFGHGDGGGGPTSQMVESALRLADGPPSSQLPQVVLEPVRSLVRRVLDRAPQLPVWDGELYLEYHQGTYTSQGWLKRMNRQNETRLQQLEWLISLAAPLGYAHDKSRLDRWWEQLLLMHFHDVLPGSSVGEVYQDVRRMQQTLADELDQAIGEAAQFLTERIDTASAAQPLVLFNTLSWDRSDPIRLPDGTWRDDVTIPAGGWRVIDAADAPTAQPSIVVAENGRRLESRYWRIELDEQGRIVQLYDRVNDRSVLRPGGVGNAWQLFEDRPLDFDAWNIDYDYEQHRLPAPKLESIQTVERGPVRTAVELTWSLPQVDGEPQTRIRQRLALYEHHPRIDFETQIDWHEHHKLLKTAFEVNIRATQAAHEVQFGHLYRPTHRNTSWDRAKYETCAHRWVDLSEHGYGVALLNDCKYGHDIHDGVIRLTCIKSAQSPDASADQGHHQFTYSLLPHAGSLQEAGVIRAAAELNTPAVVHTAAPTPGRLPAHQAGPRCDSPAVMLSTVKPAESGRGLVLRLYEAHGSHTQAQVKLPQPPTSARYVNLLEEPMDEAGDLRVEGDTLTLSLSPFQIVSLHVTFS